MRELGHNPVIATMRELKVFFILLMHTRKSVRRHLKKIATTAITAQPLIPKSISVS